MTLTKEEIEMIEREAWDFYPDPKVGYSIFAEQCRDVHKFAATEYLLQLKEERERAGKLMEALGKLSESVQHLFDMKQKNGSMNVVKNAWNIVAGRLYTANKLINEYNNTRS